LDKILSQSGTYSPPILIIYFPMIHLLVDLPCSCFPTRFSTKILYEFPVSVSDGRDSSVGTATNYGLDDRMIGVRIPVGDRNFSLHHSVRTGSGIHSASYPVGIRGYFPGVKRLGYEVDRSPPSSAGVKECVELYLHSPIYLHGVVLSQSTRTTLPLTQMLMNQFHNRLKIPNSVYGAPATIPHLGMVFRCKVANMWTATGR
jgi:hypothetical protein